MQDKPRKVTSEYGFLELATILSGFLLAVTIFGVLVLAFNQQLIGEPSNYSLRTTPSSIMKMELWVRNLTVQTMI